MKKIFIFLTLTSLVSCEKNVTEVKSPFNYEKTKDAKIEADISSFVSTKLMNTKSDIIKQFDFSNQEVLENTELNQSAIMISSVNNSTERLIFNQQNNDITDALIMDIIDMTENEYVIFNLSDLEGNPILKAEFDFINKTYNVLELYGSSKKANWGCNLSLGTAGILWTTAFGMVTAGAGAVVGVAWLVFQTWACQ